MQAARNQIEDEVNSYVATEFKQVLATFSKPLIRAAVHTRPSLGIVPFVQIEVHGSELRGTVGYDFPVDLPTLPMGQTATLLVKEPKLHVRVESHVRFSKKRLKVRAIDARVGFSARPIGSDTKDIHWGRTFKPGIGVSLP